VIGSDNLTGLKSWIKYEELLASYPFIVMTRKHALGQSDAEKMFSHLKHDFSFIEVDEEASSTKVRKNPSYRKKYLTEQVYQYIIKNHLYEE
jgi:nicotinic acid mononucleotide adenylyltransferase